MPLISRSMANRTSMREQRARLSRNNDTIKAINYCLNRWDAFTRA